MRHHPSPIRHTFELILNLVGRGPRRSRFTPARDPHSRMRFAQYVSRVQPVVESRTPRSTSRLLGQGGALSSGVVRHAPLSEMATGGLRRPTLQFAAQTAAGAARRRGASFIPPSSSLRTLLDALRLR